MTLEEAIEILELDKKCEYEGPGEKLEEALQLGIEALKDLQYFDKIRGKEANARGGKEA